MSQVVLVTGASRWLGRELCRWLVAEGHTLLAAARDPQGTTGRFVHRTQSLPW